MQLSSELFKKYNIAGPRYTSYPTVPYWDSKPTETQWIESISKALDENKTFDRGAALYVHIPFCESLCTYCGCNTRISRNHKVARPYVMSLLKEWKLYQSLLNQTIPLGEIHLGGGTPTFLSPEELEELIEGILSLAKVADVSEFSVEVDPRVTLPEHLKTLYRFGFKRLSLGVQDFDPFVQEVVHRVQSEEQVEKITTEAREIGYTSVNYDLIYGLPFQTFKSIQMTVNAVTRLRPDRIAFYGYAHVPWIKPSQRRFTDDDIPVGDQKRALYELGRQMLEEAGYSEIGMDHFAVSSDSLWIASKSGTLHRNFMGYTSRHVAPLIGLGVSAIGDSWTVFAQNEKLVETYQQRVEKGDLPLTRGHQLSAEDLVIRQHILNLMTRMHTSWDVPAMFTPDLENVHERLKELENDGLVFLSESSCQITQKGRAFLRNICMAFDARLMRSGEKSNHPSKAQLFSRTI